MVCVAFDEVPDPSSPPTECEEGTFWERHTRMCAPCGLVCHPPTPDTQQECLQLCPLVSLKTTISNVVESSVPTVSPHDTTVLLEDLTKRDILVILLLFLLTVMMCVTMFTLMCMTIHQRGREQELLARLEAASQTEKPKSTRKQNPIYLLSTKYIKRHISWRRSRGMVVNKKYVCLCCCKRATDHSQANRLNQVEDYELEQLSTRTEDHVKTEQSSTKSLNAFSEINMTSTDNNLPTSESSSEDGSSPLVTNHQSVQVSIENTNIEESSIDSDSFKIDLKVTSSNEGQNHRRNVCDAEETFPKESGYATQCTEVNSSPEQQHSTGERSDADNGHGDVSDDDGNDEDDSDDDGLETNGCRHEPESLQDSTDYDFDSDAVMDTPDDAEAAPCTRMAGQSGSDSSFAWTKIMELYTAVEAQLHRFLWIAGCKVTSSHLEVVIDTDFPGEIDEEKAGKELRAVIREDLHTYLRLTCEGASLVLCNARYGSGCTIHGANDANQPQNSATVTIVGCSENHSCSYVFSVKHFLQDGERKCQVECCNALSKCEPVSGQLMSENCNLDVRSNKRLRDIKRKVYDIAMFKLDISVSLKNGRNVYLSEATTLNIQLDTSTITLQDLGRKRVLILAGQRVFKGKVNNIHPVTEGHINFGINVFEIVSSEELPFQILPGHSGSLVTFLPQSESNTVKAFAYVLGHRPESPNIAVAVLLWEAMGKVCEPFPGLLNSMTFFDHDHDLDTGIGSMAL